MGVSKAGGTNQERQGGDDGRVEETVTAMWGEWKEELERYDDEQRLIPEPIDVAKLERQAYERDFREWEREQDDSD